MTKRPLEKSFNKTYTDQQAFLPEGYEVPKILDAATAMFMEYVVHGREFYSNVCTHCQELHGGGLQAVVGSMKEPGLYIFAHPDQDGYRGMGAVRRL